MVYLALTAVFILLALILVGLAVKTLIKPTWVLGWLKGTAGLLLLFSAILLALFSLDIYSYKPLLKNKSIANLSFTEVQPQQYKVTIIGEDGQERTYDINGDLWQLDARVLTWSDSLARMGLMPGYRLDRISGRYVSLEEEKSKPRSVHALYTAKPVVDVWEFLNSAGKNFNLIKSSYGSATYLPMRDGALYSVKLTHSGLAAIPLNDRAKAAIDAWQ